jgi:hypothetical protein
MWTVSGKGNPGGLARLMAAPVFEQKLATRREMTNLNDGGFLSL